MAGFAAQIGNFRARSLDDLDKKARAIALDLFAGTIMATPVDTGRARGNWQIATQMKTGTTDRLDKGGGSVISECSAFMGKGYFIKPNAEVWLTNNLPYIGVLEYNGHSKQAPAGMVRINMARIRNSYGV